MSVARLSCESLRDPIGIDTPRPRLSWTLESRERGRSQTAYQIAAGGWDSGKVLSRQQTHVAWGGPTLDSGQRVTWRVRVWDDGDRPSSWSAPAVFEMGLLHPGDWTGTWIAATDRLPGTPDTLPAPDRAARWLWAPDRATGEISLRKTFTIPEGRRIKRAFAIFAADDRMTLSINARSALHAQGTSAYATGSITSLLRPGENVATVVAANADGPGGVLGRITIEFDEGEPLSVPTNASWTATRNQDAGSLAKEVAQWNAPPWGRVGLPVRADPAPFMRRAFTVDKPIASARAYVAAVGYGELHLNGGKVSDHVMDPGFTRFDRRVLYVTHDVTEGLRQGKNTLGVVLGNGHYNQHAQDVWHFQVAPWRNTPRMLMELRIRYTDGTSQTITSDDRWQVSTAGPIVLDGIRNGEVYDARLEKPDWARPGGDEKGWRQVVAVTSPGGKLSAPMMAPIRVTETLTAKKITEPRPGVFVLDFGQNIAGWARLAVEGPAGTQITMRFAERLTDEGLLEMKYLHQFLAQGPFETDTYVLKGQGIETWEPRFTYHGFQYVEVTGFPGRPTAANITARVAHTAFETIGRFASSNELFNRIWRATLWSYRGNYHSIPTDCPHREKNGWTADAHLAAEQAMFNFDNAAGYTKWVQDIRDEMKETGELPGIVPTGGWGYQWGNGPAWDSALFLIPWYQYQYTGDRQILEASYGHFQRYLAYLDTRDYLQTNPSGWLGDWVPAKDKTPQAVTHAGYHHVDARIAAETARLLGRPDEAARYEAVAARVKKAFQAKFYDPATGRVADDQQTALAAALTQGLVDERDHPRVLARLVANIEKKKGHLDTGVLGAKYLPWALTDGGRADLFYRIANQRDFPGWGEWFEKGATTLWEDWFGNSSRNHVFFGDISAWFFRAVAGINPDPQAPGFERIIFKPQIGIGGLEWAEAETRSVRGRIASSWRRRGQGMELTVVVPVNSSGKVYVPAAKPEFVTTDGARFLRSEGANQVYDVGSGTTSFLIK